MDRLSMCEWERELMCNKGNELRQVDVTVCDKKINCVQTTRIFKYQNHFYQLFPKFKTGLN